MLYNICISLVMYVQTLASLINVGSKYYDNTVYFHTITVTLQSICNKYLSQNLRHGKNKLL